MEIFTSSIPLHNRFESNLWYYAHIAFHFIPIEYIDQTKRG